jgi:hypothetical protein
MGSWQLWGEFDWWGSDANTRIF